MLRIASLSGEIMDWNAAGFLGTNATNKADLSLVLGFLVAFVLTVGAIMAVRKRYTIHQRIQTVGVLLNLLQVLVVMMGSFADNVSPGIPDELDIDFYQVAAIHAFAGFIAATFGTFVMLRGNKLVPKFLQFNNYKPFMRTAYTLYMVVTLLGVWTYYTWYVKDSDSPPEVVNSIEVQTSALSNQVAQVAAGLANGDLNAIRLHAEDVYNIIIGSQGAQFGDLDGDGSVQNSGDGFGLLANGDQAGYLADARSDDESSAAIDEMIGWAEEMADLALALSQADDVKSVGEQVARLSELSGLITQSGTTLAPVPVTTEEAAPDPAATEESIPEPATTEEAGS